jgi:hypothetical protein
MHNQLCRTESAVTPPYPPASSTATPATRAKDTTTAAWPRVSTPLAFLCSSNGDIGVDGTLPFGNLKSIRFMLYDCVTFFNELELLELRMRGKVVRPWRWQIPVMQHPCWP